METELKGLRKNERCPLHGKYTCCGRDATSKGSDNLVRRRGPVTRIEDPTVPRGYREICTPAELRRRKHVLIQRQMACYLCGEPFTDYDNIELEHRIPKGHGGGTRDDHWDNLRLAHKSGNRDKGSQRLENYDSSKGCHRTLD